MMIRTKYDGWYFIVYKTTNLVNGKFYVGKHQTKKINDGYIGDGIRRQSSAILHTPLHNAVKKYGYDNFKRDTLEFCKDKYHLNEKEIWWILELQATDKKIGYNITNGGEGGDTLTNHPDYDKIISTMIEDRKGLNTGHIVLETTREKIRKTFSEKPILICPWCGLQSRSVANMRTYHFDNCKMNPNRIIVIKEKKPDTREIITCPWCGFQSKSGSGTKQFHFDNCKKKPGNDSRVNRIVSEDSRIKISEALKNKPILTCPYCGFQGKSNMYHYHFDNCKHNPNKNIEITNIKTE
jgi:hypothetical protein